MESRNAVVRAMLLAALLSSALTANASSASTTERFEPALRDLWTRGSERFQRQWLIAGPVRADSAATLDPAVLQPGPGKELIEGNGQVRWAPQTSWSDVTELPAAHGREGEHVVFVATSIQSSGGRADLAIGSDRGYAVWLNGRQVHAREQSQPFAPDADRVAVDMKPGSNLVLMRLSENGAGPSQLSLRAVAPGSLLRPIDEITPSLVDATDSGFAIRTHVVASKGSAPVAIDVSAAGGEVAASRSASRGELIRFDAQGWRDGPYDIRVSTQDAWGRPSVRYLAWYKGDAIAAVRRLGEAARTAKQDVDGDHVRMLAAMVNDRLGGSLDTASRDSWRKIHSPLMEFQELQLESQGRVGSVRAGGFVRLAYRDDVDGSTQYCRAYLPQDYAAGKRSPLILSLHGFNPANPEYIDWWLVDERHNPIANTRSTILIEVHGRGNAQYLGIGDRDVMRCLAEAKKRFAVDDDRVYLTGDSMGGHGTWAIASRHPDLFAAAAPIFGGWDFRITNVSAPVDMPKPQSPLEAFSFERSSSFSNAENLLHVPLLVTHGDSDRVVHVENSRHAVRLLQRWGYDVQYHEMPGWGHEDLNQRAVIADWLLSHKRVAAPTTVRLRSAGLEGASAYWVRVRAFEAPAEVIRVMAEVIEPGVIRIDSSNVAALDLALPDSLRGKRDVLSVVWNGQSQEVAVRNGIVQLGSAPATGLSKRVGLEGPLPAVIATPFAVVTGTISSDAQMREIVQGHADLLARQWRNWQHQPLRMIKDTKLTAADEKAYSLILLGGPDANAVTRRLARKLPFNASAKAITVDGRDWQLTDAVLQAIYPSPVAADRYVYVVAATSPAGMYFWKPQLVNFTAGFPITMFDWVIQDGRRPPAGTFDPAAAYVAAGVFDGSWRRQDRFVRLRDERIAEKWTLRRAPFAGATASEAALRDNAGRYELFPGFILTVRVDGSALAVDVPGEPTIRLVSESDSIFINAATGDVAEFVRDSNGRVSGVSVDNQGGIVLAKRVD